MRKQPDEAVSYGGQAVMEGVMMRGRSSYALSVRAPGGGISTLRKPLKSPEKRPLIWRLPITRGIAAFGSSLYLGVKTLYDSADMAGLSDLTEENPSKFDKWLDKTFGKKLFEYIIYLSMIISVAFSVGLFMLLPAWLSGFITQSLGAPPWMSGVVEGLARITIFVCYLALVSRMKEIRRVFEYHGAEHKTINCYESGAELTVSNVRGHSRKHKRCGTSFLLIVMVVSMILFFFVRIDNIWLKLLSRLALVPVVAGLSYELIKWAGRSRSLFVRIVSAPGLWLQRLTTREPDDSQIEVAISALKGVLEDDSRESHS